MPDDTVLLTTLELAVPMWIDRLRHSRGHATDEERARIVDLIASKGDALQFGGKRNEAAEVFNAMAKGLAILSYTPGGVTFRGQHWCAEHQICIEADQRIAAGLAADTAADAQRPIVDLTTGML